MSEFIHTKPRYSIKETMFLLGVSRGQVYKAIDRGELKIYKSGKRSFISPAALDNYVAFCEINGAVK